MTEGRQTSKASETRLDSACVLSQARICRNEMKKKTLSEKSFDNTDLLIQFFRTSFQDLRTRTSRFDGLRYIHRLCCFNHDLKYFRIHGAGFCLFLWAVSLNAASGSLSPPLPPRRAVVRARSDLGRWQGQLVGRTQAAVPGTDCSDGRERRAPAPRALPRAVPGKSRTEGRGQRGEVTQLTRVNWR